MQDYLSLEPALAAFYSGSPWDREAYRRKSEELGARFDRERRARCAAAIRPTSTRARERLARFVEEGGAFVTTGQQPGLFTGPLYTVYKALSAVRLAETLERELELPVLPLFWIASEDHDWAEVNHATILDVQNELQRVAVEPPDDLALPIHGRALGPPIESVVDRFIQFLPGTEFSERHFKLLRKAYRAGRTLADAFHEVLAALLEPFDLLLVDAADPVVKSGSAAVFRREVEAASAQEARLREHSARLVAAGYHAQVPVLEGALNLFLNGPLGRERVFQEEGAYRLRRSGLRIAAAELGRVLTEEPSRFSPNVLLRPVVESTVFPVLAYVAGPAELSYYAQIGCLFDAHAIQMPLIFPRFSVLLVEAKTRKVLDKFELEARELARPLPELESEIARKEIPEAIREVMDALQGGIVEGAAQLLEAARKIDSTLKGPVTHARNESLAAFEELEKKIVQALKRQDEIALSQVAKAQAHLFPEGKPQERVLNVFYYLVRYGADLLPIILDRFEVALARSSPQWRGIECGARG
ncbi:MAG: bacillithiol biosynthesis cysteine-adding enzyme BshC [Gemmatimonadetes bacterium]|nr:bacillithiol biosynthesis cysteine-adding enzyme BshC [Gemmatimonadota bacterium]